MVNILEILGVLKSQCLYLTISYMYNKTQNHFEQTPNTGLIRKITIIKYFVIAIFEFICSIIINNQKKSNKNKTEWNAEKKPQW